MHDRILPFINNHSNEQDFADKINFLSFYDNPCCVGDVNDSNFYDELCRNIEVSKANILIIDPLISFHVGDENSNVGMRTTLYRFTELSRKYKLSTLVVHHTGKGNNKSGPRGAQSIADWASHTISLSLSKETGPDKIVKMSAIKSRYSAGIEPITLIFDNYAFKPMSNTKLKYSDAYQSVLTAVSKSSGHSIKQCDLLNLIVQEYKNTTSKSMSSSKARTVLMDMIAKNLVQKVCNGTMCKYSA